MVRRQKRPHLDRALTSEESCESPESTALTPCSIRPPAHAATQRIRSRQSARDCHSRRLTSAWKPGTAPADLHRLTDATASSRLAMARLLRASVAIWAAVAPGRRPAWPDGHCRAVGWGGVAPGWGRGPCAGRCAARWPVRRSFSWRPRRDCFSAFPSPGLSGLLQSVFSSLDDHHSR